MGELCVTLKRTSSSARTSKAKCFDDTYYVFVLRQGEVKILGLLLKPAWV